MSERPRRSSSLAQAEQRHAVKAKNEAWSEIENKWFREAYAKFGSAWGPVSEYIGTRNYAACKTYYWRLMRKGLLGDLVNKKGVERHRVSRPRQLVDEEGHSANVIDKSDSQIKERHNLDTQNDCTESTSNPLITAEVHTSEDIEGISGDELPDVISPPLLKSFCDGCPNKCSLCDVEGTSAKLMEYFESARARKIEFHQQWQRQKKSQEYSNITEQYFDANKEFIKQILKETYEATGKTDKNKSNEQKCKGSELTSNSIFQIVQNALMEDTSNSIVIDACAPDEAQDDNSSATATCEEDSSKSTGAAKLSSHPVKGPPSEIDTHSGPPKFISEDQDIDASFFIGKPIRLFCSNENAYHIGRILDWREQTPVKDPSNYNLDLSATVKRKRQTFNAGLSSRNSNKKTRHVGDGSITQFYNNLLLHRHLAKKGIDDDFFQRREVLQTINNGRKVPSCKAEFLVRFKAGQDGRKVAVHHWLILEEHALSVGIAVAWCNIGGHGSDEGKWRPGSLHLRSALEMVPMQELNPQLPNIKYQDHSTMTSTEIVDDTVAKPLKCFCLLFGPEVPHYAVLKVKDSCLDISMNPCHLTTNTTSLHACIRRVDKSLAIATTMSCMELQEQRRLRKWHKLETNWSGACCSFDILSSSNTKPAEMEEVHYKKQPTPRKSSTGLYSTSVSPLRFRWFEGGGGVKVSQGLEFECVL